MEFFSYADVPKVHVVKPLFSRYERHKITVKATSSVIMSLLYQMHRV